VNSPSVSVLPNSKAIHFIEGEQHPKIADWSDIGWSLADAGPIHGVILVERARTFGSKLIDLRWNVERLRIGAKTIGFTEESIVDGYTQGCKLLLEVNHSLLERQDASVVMVFSPVGVDGTLRWQSIAYLAPIPFERLSYWYQTGCELTTTEIGIIPNSVFPSSIKHRSRIHYWLADRMARERNRRSVAVLIDKAKRLGDSSIANLLFVDGEQNWFTPEQEYSHHGTTLKQSIELLKRSGVAVESRAVSYDEGIAAQEIILVGSTGVAWSASSLDDVVLPTSRIHCQRLQSLWVDHLQYDFTAI
jgi:D-alanine transaminase/branched-chain amino acid aminotransferase